jgi:D-alanine-D-alanine ligase
MPPSKPKRNKLFVIVLAPQVQTADPTIDYYYDFSQSIVEFTRAFAQLNILWKWQPVTMNNYREIITETTNEFSAKNLLFFNLCDGDEVNGVPGVSVIDCLEENNLNYTGANRHFYQITTSKIVMKEAFDKAGVSHSPWFGITKPDFHLNGEFKSLPKPVIVKPAVSAGSMGLGIRNVVHTEEELKTLVKELYKGHHGWELSAGGFVAESFIKGREFTSFIIGSGDKTFVYPPVERAFNKRLPELEKFLSFDRLWEFYEAEKPVGDDEDFYNYQPVAGALAKEIAVLSKRAYKAVGGTGYARIDLRRDEESGTLYVLEVNAQCGLSEDENHTSIGAILRFAAEPYAAMLQRIIRTALPPKIKRMAKPKTSSVSAYLPA